MTIAEAGLLARLNSRSQWLFENGYRARVRPGKNEAPERIVEVLAPGGEIYEVLIPARTLLSAERAYLNGGEAVELLDLSGELTAYQEEFNLLRIGSCTCPFWRKHNGRYWCKHYLGAPLLLAQERAAKAREATDRAARVVEAMRCESSHMRYTHAPVTRTTSDDGTSHGRA